MDDAGHQQLSQGLPELCQGKGNNAARCQYPTDGSTKTVFLPQPCRPEGTPADLAGGVPVPVHHLRQDQQVVGGSTAPIGRCRGVHGCLSRPEDSLLRLNSHHHIGEAEKRFFHDFMTLFWRE